MNVEEGNLCRPILLFHFRFSLEQFSALVVRDTITIYKQTPRAIFYHFT